MFGQRPNGGKQVIPHFAFLCQRRRVRPGTRHPNSVIDRPGWQTLIPGHPIALREHDAPQPAWKCLRLPKLAQFPVGGKKRLLRGVLGHVDISQPGERARVGHVLEPDDQFGKRPMPLLQAHVNRPGLQHQFVDFSHSDRNQEPEQNVPIRAEGLLQ